MDTSRGAVPADFAVDACVDGRSIWIRNQLGVPIRFEARGSAGAPTKVEIDQTLAAIITRRVAGDDRIVMPADVVRYPLGPGAGSVHALDIEAAGVYAIAKTASTFVPADARQRVWDAVAGFVVDVDGAFRKHMECLPGKNWIGQAGCRARLYGRIAAAVFHRGVSGVVGGLLGRLVDTKAFLSWMASHLRDLRSLTAGTTFLEQAAAEVPATEDDAAVTEDDAPRATASPTSAPRAPTAAPPPTTTTRSPRTTSTNPPQTTTTQPPPSGSKKIALSRGGSAPHGYWYSVTLSGFSPGSKVTVTCRDSVDPDGFYNQTFTMNSSGKASDSTLCYSADGPDHWVTGGGAESNHVRW